jgi:class 3 adenylate cyclase
MNSTAISSGRLDKYLYGSQAAVGLREFVTNSGLFWIFDALLESTVDGFGHYLQDSGHWLLLIASVVQTVVISRKPDQRRWMGNFVAPVLYSILEIITEGAGFFSEVYHLMFWLYATGMALAYALNRTWPAPSSIIQGVIHTGLLPVMYMMSEEAVWSGGKMSPYTYWFEDSGHLFILLASLLFGVLLGISTLLHERLERLLRDLTLYLERLTNWVFDPALVAASFDDTSKLALRCGQRTILFMDIRGFTPWSEQHDPAEVVQLVNAYYTLAEQVIDRHNGFKIQMMGDGIMTRFNTAEAGVRAARELQAPMAHLLYPHGLGAGIGLHTGDVIEGLIGTAHTRQYGIIGDTVNVAARLQGAALRGEVVFSAETCQFLPPDLMQGITCERTVSIKGKSVPVQIYVFAGPNESQ